MKGTWESIVYHNNFSYIYLRFNQGFYVPNLPKSMEKIVFPISQGHSCDLCILTE